MKIKQEVFEIKGHALEGLNPLPAFRPRKLTQHKCTDRLPLELKKDIGTVTKPMPYLMQDRIKTEPEILKLKSFVLENEYLHARFLPEYGGRLHSLFDKKAKRDLLFTNTIIKPCNLAIRNAWLSGGIEWNIGNLGHTYTTCDNVFTAILQDEDGNDFLRIYEFERNKSIFWQVDFHLPEGSKHLISHVKMFNVFDKTNTTYWWTNIACPSATKTRVLSSCDKVISFTKDGVDYDVLPKLDSLGDHDATFSDDQPPHSFDYFIQYENKGDSTWEAAVYDDGNVFYERSTAPLYYKKLFGWGNHRGANRWQEFLSDGKGTGYYVELQAGIAPSQIHDKLFPPKSVYEWTQCFAGTQGDLDVLFGEYKGAVKALDKTIDSELSKEQIEALNEKYKVYANLPVKESNLVHKASGFGALESLRMAKDKDGEVPTSMLFPLDTIGEAEKPWLNLLETGEILDVDASARPISYMTSERWGKRILEATKKAPNYNAYLHLGVSTYEYQPTDVILNQAYSDEAEEKQVKEAESAWLKSLEYKENIWAFRNLAYLEIKRENFDKAEEYFDKALKLDAIKDDFAMYGEIITLLSKHQKNYQKAWDVYSSMPKKWKKVDRITIAISTSAVQLNKLDFLEEFFNMPHFDVREGEASLTDVWFEYCARKRAKELGITDLTEEKLEELIDEAWDITPPPYEIDFRMHTNKKKKYRVAD